MKNKDNNKKYMVRKQFYKLLITSVISFFICFIMLGFFLALGLNYVLFKETDKEINEYKNIINTEIKVTYDRFNERRRIIIGKDFDPRIKVIFYNKELEIEAISNSIFAYVIDGYDNEFRNEFDSIPNFDYEKAINNQLFIINDKLNVINNFEVSNASGNEYYFKTCSFEIDNDNANNNNIAYCKVLVMVNDFVDVKNGVLSIYIITGFILILSGLAVSAILSKKAVKPVEETFSKQIIFVSDASHEIKTPLTIIKSKLENILVNSDKKVIECTEEIAISLSEITRLNKLVNDLLELARSDSGADKILFEENVNLKEIIEETAKPFIEFSELYNKKFITNLEEVYIKCDIEKIKQLLIIFFDNAIKYTKENDIIEVRLEKNNNEAIIKISDTGIGLKSCDKKYIFERFYREDKARSRENGGNGLGLAIAKTIIDSHGGKVSVTDNNPMGTVFIIGFPRK